MKKCLYLLDGYSLIYRSHFVFIRNPIINKYGKNRSVLYGFFNSLFSFVNQYKMENFVVVLDPPKKTFRNKIYPEYKANRDKAPQELHEQVPIVKEILNALKIPTICVENYEADDVIATLATRCTKEKRYCKIITGDKDLLQLVNDFVTILKPDSGSFIEMTYDKVVEKYGIPPKLVLDFLSLTGDKADNVPGVDRVGEKTALKLLLEYNSLENIFDNTDKLKGKLQEYIINGKENAFLSKELITLIKDVKFDLDIDNINININENKEAAEIFIREDLNSLARKAYSKKIENSEQEEVQDTPKIKRVKDPIFTEYETFKDGSVEIIDNVKILEKWVEKCSKAKIFSFDTETTSLDDMSAELLGFSFATSDKKGAYAPIIAEDSKILDLDEVIKIIKPLLENKENFIIGQNIKYDIKVMKRYGININPSFDTMIAAWLCNSSTNNYSMDFLACKYCGYQPISFKDIVEKGKSFSSVELKTASDYAGEDAFVTFKLYKYFKKRLQEEDLENIFYEIEMPLLNILAKMEMNGISLDSKELEIYSKELEKSLGEITDKLYKECGEEFNIRSPKQLQRILFGDSETGYEGRKLTPTKKIKSGYSTDESVLQYLSKFDIVPKLILEHRKLSKLKSTYVDTLPKLINEQTNKLHTRFIQTGTATGRLSSKDPNLQNIPIKDEEGRRIRMAFKASKGNFLLSADYSQIELVVLAELSQDPQLIKAFKEGLDIHSQTASLLFDTQIDEVTSDQRRIGKTINFGIMYGMSAYRLSNELNIPMKKGATFINSYFRHYNQIKVFTEEVYKNSRKSEFVYTILGHKREIYGINSRNKTEKQGAERVSLNTTIQGSAADIVKKAMINIDKKIIEKNLKSKMILQIHDELLFDVPKDELEIMKSLVKDEMENAIKLSIPIKASIETAKNWGELH